MKIFCQDQYRACQRHAWGLSAALIFSPLLATGCAHWSFPGKGALGASTSLSESTEFSLSAFDRAAIGSLTDAFSQVYNPQTTTLQAHDAGDAYYQWLVSTLSDLGYGIQRVDADQGAHFLELQRVPGTGASDLDLVSYSLSAGVVQLQRDFLWASADAYRPMGPLNVSGTRSNMGIDDARFEMSAQVSDHVTRIEYAALSEAVVTLPIISLINDDVVEGVARSAIGQAPGTPSLQALNSSKIEVNNLFFGSNSAFDDLRDEMNRVDRLTIIFPNDSLRLGSVGKAQIRHFLTQYQQGLDLIGLIGCSNGRTQLAIGNEGLALGRSQRVIDELRSLGVARDAILDEGCWASESAGDRFPSRGVVMELLRREA